MPELTPAVDVGLLGGPMVEIQLTHDDHLALWRWIAQASGSDKKKMRRHRRILAISVGLATFFLVLFTPLAFGIRPAQTQLWLLGAFPAAACTAVVAWLGSKPSAARWLTREMNKQILRTVPVDILGSRRVGFHPLGLIVETPRARSRLDWWLITGVARTADHVFVRLRIGPTRAVILPRRYSGVDQLAEVIEHQLSGRDIDAIQAAVIASPTTDWGTRPASAVEYELTEADMLIALKWSQRHGYFDGEIRGARGLLVRRTAAPVVTGVALLPLAAAFGRPWALLVVAIALGLVVVPTAWRWFDAPRSIFRSHAARVAATQTPEVSTPTWLWLDGDGVNEHTVGTASHVPWWRLADLDECDGLVLWRRNDRTVAVPRRADPAGVEQLVAGLRAGMAGAHGPTNDSDSTPPN